jgi:hypothetical protein
MNAISSNGSFKLALNASFADEAIFTAGWTEIGGSPKTAEQGNNEGESNGATAVEIVPAPAAGFVRQLTSLSVYNPNAEPVVVSLVKAVDSSGYLIGKWTLQSGKSLIYTDKAGFWVESTATGSAEDKTRCGRVTKSAAGTHTITFPVAFTSSEWEVEQSLKVVQNGGDIGYVSVTKNTVYGFDVEVYTEEEGDIDIIYTATLK